MGSRSWAGRENRTAAMSVTPMKRLRMDKKVRSLLESSGTFPSAATGAWGSLLFGLGVEARELSAEVDGGVLGSGCSESAPRSGEVEPDLFLLLPKAMLNDGWDGWVDGWMDGWMAC